MVDRVLVEMSKVRCDCHRLISRLDPVSDRVGRIMVDVERLDRQIPEGKFGVRQDRVQQLLRVFAEAFDLPDLVECPFCGVDRDFIFSRKDAQPLYMVGMFMGDADAVQFARL